MGRIIDADALKDYIVIHNVGCGCSEDYQKSFLESIDDQPTIGPVRKGKWIVYVVSMLDGEDCKCSECGQTSCAPYWHYCPNCGAKMEEGEK